MGAPTRRFHLGSALRPVGRRLDAEAALQLIAQGALVLDVRRREDRPGPLENALRIAPDEPSVLSNLGLSYALSKDLVRAEATLRRAASQSRIDPTVRQNLALVMGLQRGAVAQGFAALPAQANVARLRQVLAQQNGWRGSGEKPPVAAEGS